MTAETCPRCGRRMVVSDYPDADECSRMDGMAVVGDPWCDAIFAAYRRGIDRGVEIAKDELVVLTFPDGSHEKDWTDVDAAAAKAKGEAGR